MCIYVIPENISCVEGPATVVAGFVTTEPATFPLLTLLFAQGLELALIAHRDDGLLPDMLRNDTNLLLFRAFLPSFFPLLMAVRLLRRAGTELDLETLKPPFYSQCYVAAPFTIGLNSGMNIARAGHPEWVVAGTAITFLSLLWYVVVEVRWFRQGLRIGTLLALWLVARTVVEAMVLLLLTTAAFAYTLGAAFSPCCRPAFSR